MNPTVYKKVVQDLTEVRELLRNIKVEEVSELAADNLARCWEKLTDIQLQLSPEADAAAIAPPKLAKASPIIALIDDDPDVQRMVSFMLKRKGFDVHSFYDPTDALDQIVDIQPDVIILDLMMPKMSGFEFLEKFKSLRKQLPAVRIIVGSGRSFESDRIAVLKSGAHDFVAKPYSMDELVLRINNLIAA